MQYRKLNIDLPLMRYAAMVLKRDGIPFEEHNDGTLMAAVTEEEEEILIEDAMCEEQRIRENPEIPVYSWHTVCNEEKFHRLQKAFWGDENPDKGPFHLLDKDEEHMCNGAPPLTKEEKNAPIPGAEPGMTLSQLMRLEAESIRKNRAQ